MPHNVSDHVESDPESAQPIPAMASDMGNLDPALQTAVAESTPRRSQLGRATLTLTACNLVSKISGFVRIVAIAAALGIAHLGDAYQRANEISNVLYQLLAGGLLYSVLIPSFVELFDSNDVSRARKLCGALIGRGSVVMGAVVVVAMLCNTWIMQALTVGVTGPTRQSQIELGSFLLLFILPQLLFYAAGSVVSALLQTDHRFVATGLAPLFNNAIVIATMVAFAMSHDPARGFALTTGEKWLLGGGTLAGTVAMTAVPFFALWRAGMGVRPQWKVKGLNLRPLLKRGAWGAGHAGLNEILIGTTIILSGRVDGGVIAYQTAFTFFLLPFALLAYPIFTAMFPRLSKRAAAGHHDQFVTELGQGMRLISLLVLPAAGLMAVTAAPGFSVLRIGALDAHGARMVALVLAAYMPGLAGYSLFFLFTRASYALGDARRPTLVNAGVTLVSVVGMIVATSLTGGIALLIAFGIIQGVAITIGTVVLHALVMRSISRQTSAGTTMRKSTFAALSSTGAALGTAALIGWSGRLHALSAVVASSLVGIVVYLAVLTVLGTPELSLLRQRAMRRLAPRR